ncbi:hypothetical protein NIE88_15680 [Sporolactobacillus shoreicorticis]|uniref:Lipoprotein n=1 Tax=Sporolactobacillus shoreicorticis TaxID=1923877 RepID=A0ABW5S0L1_9BACL|nr:hypothetical protein [Sporolactobacillus shoreicorticis]MCO7127210.1 hypothetical protein [Sporolactobacillus shoreicorticis]
MKKVWLLSLFLLFLSLSAGCSSEQEPPNATVKVRHSQVETGKGTYEWRYGFFYHNAAVADAISPSKIAKRIETRPVASGDKAVISFSDQSHPKLTAHIWDHEKARTELPVHQNRLTLPTKPGTYVVLLHAKWIRGNSDYVLFVKVSK